MLKKVNAMGDPCPIPVIKTKNAIKELAGSGTVETLVDNEIAVQNLTRLANNSGYAVKSEKLGDKEFRVVMEVTGAPAAQTGEDDSETCLVPAGSGRNDTVVAVSSACMGTGSDELDAKFVQESVAAGFTNLKGHRSVGGMRASIYNAMPAEGVDKLVDFMEKFRKENA